MLDQLVPEITYNAYQVPQRYGQKSRLCCCYNENVSISKKCLSGGRFSKPIFWLFAMILHL